MAQQQQQQQQALHAAGGNMYMGGGGMAAIGGMHQMHQRLGYPRTNNQRPPNVSVGPPDGLGNSIGGRGAQQEWRHVLMQQQQQQGFQAQMRSQFNQQGHQGEYRARKKGRKKERNTSFVIDRVPPEGADRDILLIPIRYYSACLGQVEPLQRARYAL